MQRLLFLVCLLNLQTIITADAAPIGSDNRVKTPDYVFHGEPLLGLCRFTLNPGVQDSYYFGLNPDESSTEVSCSRFGLKAACWVKKPIFKELVEMALCNDEKSLDSFVESRQGPNEKKDFLKKFLKQLRLTSGPNNPENRKMLKIFTALNC